MSLALGKNSVNAKQPLHLDSTNHLLVNDSTNKAVLDQIATNTSNINVNVDSLEVNTDGLEALQTTTNTTLASILIDTDAIDSSCNTIEAQSVLTASRLNNIQNKISANTDGTGDTLGQINSNILTKNGEIQTTLSALNTKVTACNTGSISGTVAVSAVAGNVACTHASLPLPSGAATEAKQDVIETTLTNIETDAAALEVLQTSTNSKLDHLSGDLDTIEATLTNIETDAAAIEVLLTAANTDHAANEVLLTAIDADTSNIATSTAACATDLAALEVLQTSTNSKLDHLSGDLDTLEATLTNIETDAAANEVLLTNINSKLADVETAIEIIDNGYGTMTEETLLNATVTGSGGSATSSVHTKKREIENIGFSIAGASHGTYTAVIQFSVDNVNYHDDTNLNFGNAQLCKGTITSIGRGFKYYKVRIVNNGVDQNTTVKISY